MNTELLANKLVSWIRERVLAAGRNGVVVGMSGGVDSSVVAVLSHQAFPQSMLGVVIPCYSSQEDAEHARLVASKFSIPIKTVVLDAVYDALVKVLPDDDVDPAAGRSAKANLKPRLRMLTLYYLANSLKYMVVGASNKSELAVGYCTLYGDMVGGFSPIKDVYKTSVYDICRFINEKHSNLIPENIITKAPSAELKPGQKNQDKLPSYDILDKILKSYNEEDLGYNEILKKGFAPGIVKDVIGMVNKSEYKRRQGPPGIKITPRAFGKDRRYPITNKFIPD